MTQIGKLDILIIKFIIHYYLSFQKRQDQLCFTHALLLGEVHKIDLI